MRPAYNLDKIKFATSLIQNALKHSKNFAANPSALAGKSY